MSTLYMGASEETVAKYVLFSGDPWRVEVLKKYLDNPKKVAFMREFNTYTGTYKDVEITVPLQESELHQRRSLWKRCMNPEWKLL